MKNKKDLGLFMVSQKIRGIMKKTRIERAVGRVKYCTTFWAENQEIFEISPLLD